MSFCLRVHAVSPVPGMLFDTYLMLSKYLLNEQIMEYLLGAYFVLSP